MPGLGFYGFGLLHMIGGLAKSATSLLRQLVDAGTLANLPGGLKARGLRIKGDDTPIMPGEFRDVDVPGGSIGENISFLPYKEPSTVLYQLMGDIVEEGRRFASAADVKASDMNAEAPVGTTLAILERSMKVMSAVQARLHASMRAELRLLSNVVRDFGPETYPYDENKEPLVASDFDDRVDIIPVSDPNAGTMAQRIMQYQAALQLAQQAPQMYDMPQLHRQMLEILNIRDAEKLVPVDDDMTPVDPITENMNIINGKPVKAFVYQDHESHIMAHKAMLEDPKVMELMSQSPNAESAAAEMAAHVQEHLAFQYRLQIEKELGFELPGPEEPLPEDIEYRISRLAGLAADQLKGKNQQEAQAAEQQQQAEDPILQMQQKELQIKEMEAQRRAQSEMGRLELDRQKAAVKAELDRMRLEQQKDIEDKRIAVKLAQDESHQQMEGFKIGVDLVQDALDDK